MTAYAPTRDVTTTPRLRRLLPRRMAVVRTVGDPAIVGNNALGVLFTAARTLQHERALEGDPFDLGAPVALWLNADTAPRDEWIGVWALELPGDVAVLPDVDVETWPGGEYAEIVHRGPFDSESETLEQLRRFVADQGYEVVGVHEEQYLPPPDAVDAQRTLIRYAIRATG